MSNYLKINKITAVADIAAAHSAVSYWQSDVRSANAMADVNALVTGAPGHAAMTATGLIRTTFGQVHRPRELPL